MTVARRKARSERNTTETDLGRALYYVTQIILLLKIVLTLFVFDPYAADSFSLPKSAIAHLASFVLLGLLMALVWLEPNLVARSAMHIAVAGFLLAFVAATVFALDSYVALFGTSRRYLGLSQTADNVVVYAAAALVLQRAVDLRRALVALGCASALLAAYAILQSRGIDLLKYPEASAFATFGQPDIAGGFFGVAAVTFAVIGAYVLLASKNRLLGSAAVGVGLLCLGAFAVNGVRNGVLAIGAGLIAGALIGLKRGTRYRAFIVTVGLLALIAVIATAVSPVGARLRPDLLRSDASVLGRLEIWETALRLWSSRPLLGLGPDNFAVGYPAARGEISLSLNGIGVLQNSTHNWPLHVATSAGIAGALGLVAIFATGTLAIAREGRQGLGIFAVVPLTAYVGQSLVNVSDVALEWVPWMCLGVVASAYGRRAAAPESRRSADQVTAVAVLGVLFLIGSSLVASNELARIQASEALATSTGLASRGNALQAVSYARVGLAADGGRSEYWNGFGAALSAAGNPGAAAQGFAEATSRSPWEPTYWRNLGAAKFAANDVAGATAAFERAVRADPLDAQSHDLLARLAFNRGDFGVAANEGAIAVRLTPSNGSAYDAPVLAYLQLGRPGDAESLLNAGLTASDNAHGRALLARVLYVENRLAESRVQVSRALAMDPADPEALSVRALLDSR